jgi:hypothetical protein
VQVAADRHGEIRHKRVALIKCRFVTLV